MPTYAYFYKTQRTRIEGITLHGRICRTAVGEDVNEGRFRAKNDRAAKKRAKEEGFGKIYRVVSTRS